MIGYLLLMSFMTLSFMSVAQSPNYNLGRTPSQNEIDGWANPISPTGEELPAGRGTATEGAQIYNRSCIFCHGPEGQNGAFPSLRGNVPLMPYATTIWDYIYRAMPRRVDIPGAQERQLSADETYALTAYILSLNGIIDDTEVMDAQTLPEVVMPIKTYK
jgi:cytochrome c